MLVAAFASTVQSLLAIAWQLTASLPTAVIVTSSTAGEQGLVGVTARFASARLALK
ncbi:MAG: hypothetical protein ACHREM_02605 [Polyangiales bacterium]